jgi:5-(carboxyamino)imidazole ribonucleotide synthase
VVGAINDPATLNTLTEGATDATYEWEGVPAHAADHVARRIPVRPGRRALEVAQDRLSEKDTFARLGIGVPAYMAVDVRDDLDRAIAHTGLPAVLKTRRGGYDGKGQFVLRTPADADPAFDVLGDVPTILEGFVPFTRELSVVAARGLDGETQVYPLVENRHVDGILRVTRAPAPDITDALRAESERVATLLLDHLGYVGVLAVELFEVDGHLLANEMAPRVHNSGHWTIEGAVTSQFEQHLRAVLGWPLGSTAPRGVSAMVNCIGAMPDRDAVLAIEGAHLHDYAKDPRPGRKVGHVTVTATTEAELDARLARVEASCGSSRG